MTRNEVPMSRFGLLAFLMVVCSSAAASACCLFKCCHKPVVYLPAGQTTVPPEPFAGSKGTVKITQVDGEAPDSTNNIHHDVPSTNNLIVVVESDFDPSLGNPQLTLTDLGPRSALVLTEKSKKKYKPFKIQKKPKPDLAPAPSPGPAPPPPGTVWQAFYLIPSSDLSRGHNYSIFATVGTATSNTVTFHTAQ